MPADRSSATPPRALVDFALRSVQIASYVCSRQQHEHGYDMVRRTLSDYNLLFITRGRPVWHIDHQPIELRPQDLLIVRPGEPHHATCRTKRVTLTSLHVTATLPGGGDVFDLMPPPRVQQVRRGSRLDGYLRGACAEFDRGDDDRARLMMPGWARLVVLELLSDNAERGLLGHRPIDPLIAEVLDELARRVDRALSLEELARWAGYTPQHLNRVFRRTLGVTPLQYLGRMRMEAAGRLLSEGRLSVAAIARRVGIDDPYYFSRVFRRHFEVSPAQYRRASGSDCPS